MAPFPGKQQMHIHLLIHTLRSLKANLIYLKVPTNFPCGWIVSRSLPIQDANAVLQLGSRLVWEQRLNFLPFWSLAEAQLPEALNSIPVKSPKDWEIG
jgi:hypothetical protein